ncbi:MAG TPA: DsbA family oxidoreductase [Chitinophagaceae bacterium]
MKVEIWSDIACPFCYIGKRRFENALEQFAHKDTVQVEWKSFQLDPEMKQVPGQNIYESLAGKKGWTPEQAKGLFAQVVSMAAAEGLDYNMDATVPANTLNAHRLTHLAAQHGLQDAAEERLFQAYFMEGMDIQDTETLVRLGIDIGLQEEAVRDLLAGGAFTYEVREDIAKAQQIGVRGVPFFVIDGKYAVSGAQPVELFLQALQTARAEWEKANPPVSVLEGDGPSCDLAGNCD